jgi:V8-like Glu-specific endopeptidase
MHSKYLFRVLCGVGLTLGCSGDPSAHEADSDSATVTVEPIIGGIVASQYPEAGYLNIDMSARGGFACSGVLIAPQVMLTAGHCVDGHKKWEVYVGNAYRSSTSASVFDWHENGAETVDPTHHDLGLVFLDEAVTLAQYPTLASSEALDGTPALDVGRVLNGTVSSGAYQAATTLTDATRQGYPFDYYSNAVIQSGDSGGPVFLAGSHVIAAVNSGADSSTQVLARVDLVAQWISAQIAAHGGSVPNAAAAGDAQSSSASSMVGSGGDSGSANAAATGGASAGGADGASDSALAGAASGITGSCAQETEPNDTWATAENLKGPVCASLASAEDVDFYAVAFASGVHMIEATSTSDVSLTIGVPSGHECIPVVFDVQRARVKVTHGTRTLCIRAASPHKKTQSYQLTAN